MQSNQHYTQRLRTSLWKESEAGTGRWLTTHSCSWGYEWAVHFHYSDRRPRWGVYARITSSSIHTHTHTNINRCLTIYTGDGNRMGEIPRGISGRERDTFLTNGVFRAKYLRCRNSLEHKRIACLPACLPACTLKYCVPNVFLLH
jgi:hypothetical protein